MRCAQLTFTKLDGLHALDRIDGLSKTHGAYASFMRYFAMALYDVEESDFKAQLEQLRESGMTDEEVAQAEFIDYKLLVTKCRRQMPTPKRLRERLVSAYDKHCNIEDNGVPLFTERAKDCWKNLMVHVDLGCLSDDPQFNHYYIPVDPDGNEGDMKTQRSTSQLENFHHHLRRLYHQSFNISPEKSILMTAEFLTRWNARMSTRNVGRPATYFYDYGLLEKAILLAEDCGVVELPYVELTSDTAVNPKHMFYKSAYWSGGADGGDDDDELDPDAEDEYAGDGGDEEAAAGDGQSLVDHMDILQRVLRRSTSTRVDDLQEFPSNGSVLIAAKDAIDTASNREGRVGVPCVSLPTFKAEYLLFSELHAIFHFSDKLKDKPVLAAFSCAWNRVRDLSRTLGIPELPTIRPTTDVSSLLMLRQRLRNEHDRKVMEPHRLQVKQLEASLKAHSAVDMPEPARVSATPRPAESLGSHALLPVGVNAAAVATKQAVLEQLREERQGQLKQQIVSSAKYQQWCRKCNHNKDCADFVALRKAGIDVHHQSKNDKTGAAQHHHCAITETSGFELPCNVAELRSRQRSSIPDVDFKSNTPQVNAAHSKGCQYCLRKVPHPPALFLPSLRSHLATSEPPIKPSPNAATKSASRAPLTSVSMTSPANPFSSSATSAAALSKVRVAACARGLAAKKTKRKRAKPPPPSGSTVLSELLRSVGFSRTNQFQQDMQRAMQESMHGHLSTEEYANVEFAKRPPDATRGESGSSLAENRVAVHTTGDGGCFFHCIEADARTGDASSDIRATALEYVENHKAFYLDLIFDEDSNPGAAEAQRSKQRPSKGTSNLSHHPKKKHVPSTQNVLTAEQQRHRARVRSSNREAVWSAFLQNASDNSFYADNVLIHATVNAYNLKLVIHRCGDRVNPNPQPFVLTPDNELVPVPRATGGRREGRVTVDIFHDTRPGIAKHFVRVIPVPKDVLLPSAATAHPATHSSASEAATTGTEVDGDHDTKTGGASDSASNSSTLEDTVGNSSGASGSASDPCTLDSGASGSANDPCTLDSDDDDSDDGGEPDMIGVFKAGSDLSQLPGWAPRRRERRPAPGTACPITDVSAHLGNRFFDFTEDTIRATTCVGRNFNLSEETPHCNSWYSALHRLLHGVRAEDVPKELCGGKLKEAATELDSQGTGVTNGALGDGWQESGTVGLFIDALIDKHKVERKLDDPEFASMNGWGYNERNADTGARAAWYYRKALYPDTVGDKGRRTRMANEGGVLAREVNVLLPMHQRDSHWTLAIFNLKRGYVLVYDPMYTSAANRLARVLPGMLDELGVPVEQRPTIYSFYPDAPGDMGWHRQLGGFTCGDFACMVAQEAVTGSSDGLYAHDTGWRKAFLNMAAGWSDGDAHPSSLEHKLHCLEQATKKRISAQRGGIASKETAQMALSALKSTLSRTRQKNGDPGYSADSSKVWDGDQRKYVCRGNQGTAASRIDEASSDDKAAAADGSISDTDESTVTPRKTRSILVSAAQGPSQMSAAPQKFIAIRTERVEHGSEPVMNRGKGHELYASADIPKGTLLCRHEDVCKIDATAAKDVKRQLAPEGSRHFNYAGALHPHDMIMHQHGKRHLWLDTHFAKMGHRPLWYFFNSAGSRTDANVEARLEDAPANLIGHHHARGPLNTTRLVVSDAYYGPQFVTTRRVEEGEHLRYFYGQLPDVWDDAAAQSQQTQPTEPTEPAEPTKPAGIEPFKSNEKTTETTATARRERSPAKRDRLDETNDKELAVTTRPKSRHKNNERHQFQDGNDQCSSGSPSKRITRSSTVLQLQSPT